MNRATLLKEINLDQFIALDFETTGLQVETDRIIEVAAILFENGEPTKRFTSLVKPGIPIPTLIENITGITNKMVEDAPSEKDIIDDFFKFISNYPIVAHNTPFDLSFLNAMSIRYKKDLPDRKFYDTLTLSRAFLYFQPAHNLTAVSDYFDLSTKGAHRAEYDTENCGAIFVELIEEVSSYNLDLISRIIAFLKSFEIQNKDLFIDIGNLLTREGSFKKGLTESSFIKPINSNIFFHEGKTDASSLTANDVFGVGGNLNRTFEAFENRPNQIGYSQFIDGLFLSPGGIGVAEAGTGLGKSMAYLFPAIKHSALNPEKGPVVLSCYTKHLQDQLFNKDLPRLSNALDSTLNAVVIKGRNNYVCKTRLNWLISIAEKMLSAEEAINLLPLIIWLEHTLTGDLDECPGFTNGFTFRLMALVQSEPGYCTTPICARNDGCFFGPLRKVAYKANLVIINHALLISEAKARNISEDSVGFLPDHSTVIIDEAHNLPKAAYHQLTITLDQRSLAYFLDRIDPSHNHSIRWNNQLKSLGGLHEQFAGLRQGLAKSVINCRESIKPFFDQLIANVVHQFDSSAKYSTKIIIKNLDQDFNLLEKELGAVNSAFHTVRNHIRKIRESLLDIDETREDFIELHQLFDRGEGLINDALVLIQTLTSIQEDSAVYWYEGVFRNISGQTQLFLSVNMAPINLTEDLSNGMFNKLDHCILTSATLRTNSSFEYYLRRVGLDGVEFDDVVTTVFDSPFHYDEQVTYRQYSGSDGQRPDTLAKMIYSCHKSFNKRMMVLFTSRAQLEGTLLLLKQKQGGSELPIFAQKRQTSRTGLVRGLHQTSNGILLGTNAFWEGVDLPGDLLEVLMIVKMPFDVPSEPIVKAYGDLIEANGGNRFMDYALPESVIRFRQGFGRLIRTGYDEGTFIVMDDRIVNKRYGALFAEAIPVKMEIFNQIEEIT